MPPSKPETSDSVDPHLRGDWKEPALWVGADEPLTEEEEEWLTFSDETDLWSEVEPAWSEE